MSLFRLVKDGLNFKSIETYLKIHLKHGAKNYVLRVRLQSLKKHKVNTVKNNSILLQMGEHYQNNTKMASKIQNLHKYICKDRKNAIFGIV